MAHSARAKRSWHYNTLSNYCCRLTRPRQAILDILSRTTGHLHAKDIYKEVLKVCDHAGLATVYRNLELLVRIGLVWKFDAGDNRTRYEIAEPAGEGHHHHLICKKCNTIIDYSDSIGNENAFIFEREKKLTRKYKFKIENHSIDFYGICRTCNRAR